MPPNDRRPQPDGGHTRRDQDREKIVNSRDDDWRDVLLRADYDLDVSADRQRLAAELRFVADMRENSLRWRARRQGVVATVVSGFIGAAVASVLAVITGAWQWLLTHFRP